MGQLAASAAFLLSAPDLNRFLLVFFSRPELDSEIIDDKSKVLGVLAADSNGQCLIGKFFPFLMKIVGNGKRFPAYIYCDKNPIFCAQNYFY